MAENYEYIVTSGVIVPDTADVLTTVENEYKAAFGQDLVTTPDTPQGVLITAETLSRDTVVRNNAALANQINPNLAGGIFLDAIMALTGTSRIAATRSTVTAQLTGAPGTVIPAGVTASTAAGDLFELTSGVILQSDGTIDAPFQSVEFGPVAAPAGDLTQIVDGVLGWETITNADAAALGTTEQSDASARSYRKNTLAIQGQSLPEAITSGLYAVDGVRSLSFRENIASTTEVIDGISMVAHSIYVCVDGGTDEDVATVILEKKSAGANYNGDTTVEVVEPFSGQTYEVKFDRPDSVQILARVTIRSTGALADPVQAVKDSILAYADGSQEGEPGFTVGNDVSSFELAGAVNRDYPSIYVQLVELALASDGIYSTDPIAIGLDQIATITSGAITVITA